ncbi:MAG: hypothetical protein GX235_07800 [Clostridiales bacterium]|nr:hypothetical protein [Clostridiales bacterium]
MGNMSRSIYKWYEKRFFAILIVLSALIAGSIFVIYGYQDLKSLTVWSLNLLDVIYERRPYEYYAYCAENVYNLNHEYMGSGYLALIPWAVWNIPIWILQRWFGIIAVGHAWTLLYSKMFLVVTESIMLYYSYKITMHITGDRQKSKMAAYLTFSSPFVLISIYYTGQSDIVSLCLFVIAVYKLLNKKQRWFLVLAALGIAAKPYILLAYIAIILVIEKNIWKICAYIFAGGSVALLFNLLYADAPMFRESMNSGPTGGQLDSFLSVAIDGGIGQKIPLFIVAIVLFYFYLYISRCDQEKDIRIIYSSAVTFLIYFMLTEPAAYRMIYIVPFIYILFMKKEDCFPLNLLLEVTGTICAALVFYIRNVNFFSGWYVFQFIRDAVPGGGEAALSNARNELENMHLGPYVYIITAVYCAVLVLIIIINRSDFRFPYKDDFKLGEKTILWIRALILVPIVILSL